MVMAKQKKEVLENTSDDVEVILARVAEFNKLALSMKTAVADVKTHPDDIYFVDIKRPDADKIYEYKRFHGKCLKTGFKDYDKWGYVYIITSHTAKDEREKARTTCEHCKGQLNPKIAQELEAEWRIRYDKRKTDHERRQQLKQAREDEMVLLGLI